MNATPGIVTLVISHQVRSGLESRYEAWLSEIMPAAQRYAGHLGVNVIRPQSGSGAYTIVLRFDSHEHLKTWVESDTRKRFIGQVEPMLAEGDQIEIKTGLEFWFTPPEALVKHSRRWKQFLVTWSAIFPLVLIVSMILKPLAADVAPLRNSFFFTLLLTGIVVALVVYVVMPRYARAVSGWLYK